MFTLLTPESSYSDLISVVNQLAEAVSLLTPSRQEESRWAQFDSDELYTLIALMDEADVLGYLDRDGRDFLIEIENELSGRDSC